MIANISDGKDTSFLSIGKTSPLIFKISLQNNGIFMHQIGFSMSFWVNLCPFFAPLTNIRPGINI